MFILDWHLSLVLMVCTSLSWITGMLTLLRMLVKNFSIIRCWVLRLASLWDRRQNIRLLLNCLAVSVRLVLVMLLARTLRPGIELVCGLLLSKRPWPILQARALIVVGWTSMLFI